MSARELGFSCSHRAELGPGGDGSISSTTEPGQALLAAHGAGAGFGWEAWQTRMKMQFVSGLSLRFPLASGSEGKAGLLCLWACLWDAEPLPWRTPCSSLPCPAPQSCSQGLSDGFEHQQGEAAGTVCHRGSLAVLLMGVLQAPQSP